MWNRGVDGAINPESAERFTKWCVIVAIIALAFAAIAAIVDNPKPEQIPTHSISR